jgi:hypothetical protein
MIYGNLTKGVVRSVFGDTLTYWKRGARCTVSKSRNTQASLDLRALQLISRFTDRRLSNLRVARLMSGSVTAKAA